MTPADHDWVPFDNLLGKWSCKKCGRVTSAGDFQISPFLCELPVLDLDPVVFDDVTPTAAIEKPYDLGVCYACDRNLPTANGLICPYCATSFANKREG